MSSTSHSRARVRPGPARSIWFVAVPALFLVIAAVIIVMSGEISGREGAYPRALAIVLGAFALVSIRTDHLQARRAAAGRPEVESPQVEDESVLEHHEEGGEELEGRRGEGVAWRRVVLLAGLVALSIYLMSWLGFFLPATLLVGGGLVVLGVRSWWRVLVYTACLVVGAYLLFVEALRVPFPPLPWS